MLPHANQPSQSLFNPHKVAVVLPDIRSTYNVGAVFRTAEAAGISQLVTCGYTPYPAVPSDLRPPHVIAANTRAIAKTALGAETMVPHRHYASLESAIAALRSGGYGIVALELSSAADPLFSYRPQGPVALVLGPEVTGLSAYQLAAVDTVLALPMLGRKESLNVSVAAGIALYHLRWPAI